MAGDYFEPQKMKEKEFNEGEPRNGFDSLFIYLIQNLAFYN